MKLADDAVGLLSVLFFVFTSEAFYGTESLDLNRQIVGEFFLILSVFLLISKTIPVTKRRWLLMIFGRFSSITLHLGLYLSGYNNCCFHYLKSEA